MSGGLEPPAPQEEVQSEAAPNVPEETEAQSVEPAKHEEIKRYIGSAAEKLEFSVTYEELVLGGRGRVDVVLNRGKRRIACEIAMTTTIRHEVGNALKCIEAGFKEIVVVATTDERLEKLECAVRDAITTRAVKIHFLKPAALKDYLKNLAETDPKGGEAERKKPHRLNIRMDSTALSVEERRQREREMLSKLAKSMRCGKKSSEE